MATLTTTPVFMTGSPDYQSLMKEIKFSIDKNNNLFKSIQQSNYPDAGTYTSDLLDYKIDTKITDLKKAREDIWNFLLKKYEENSKLRIYYFTEIRKIDNYIKDLGEQKRKLIDSIENKNLKTNTAMKSVQNERYIFKKLEYYLFLYKILVLVQIAILVLITLCITGMIPKATCLIITIIILIATLAFVGYYVFILNIGRNKYSWYKFEHDNNAAPNSGQCSDNNISEADKLKANADVQIDAIIKSSRSGKTCSNKMTPSAPSVTSQAPSSPSPSSPSPSST